MYLGKVKIVVALLCYMYFKHVKTPSVNAEIDVTFLNE